MRAAILGIAGGLALLGGLPSAAGAPSGPDVAGAIEEARRDLAAARKTLTERRHEITDERIRLNGKVEVLSREVGGLREEWRRKVRLRDEFDTALGPLRDRVKQLEERVRAAGALLTEVRRNAGAQLSLMDATKYAERLAEIDRLLDGQADLPAVAEPVLGLLAEHAEHGSRIRREEGTAVAPDGRECAGTFVQIGDVLALFAGRGEGAPSGIVTLLHGSPRPHVFVDLDSGAREGIARAARGEEGAVPIDVTAGAALRKRESRMTMYEQVLAGGVVMVPILGIALIGLIVGIAKLTQLIRIRTDFDGSFERLLTRLRERDGEPSPTLTEDARPPLRRLLTAAVTHRASPRGDLEEALNEAILAEVPRLERYLSVLSVGAAIAPLLGLLGTVTGMIHTFRLISVFGTGDPRLLSGGISEALITTEAGLVVAIPLLLLHAFLSRRVHRISEGLESSAIGFLNRWNHGRADP